jgi:hypothetical protein
VARSRAVGRPTGELRRAGKTAAALLGALVFAGLAACAADDSGTGGGPGGGGGGDGDGDAAPDAGDSPGERPDAGPAADCDEQVTSGLPSGKHNAGRDCLGCHHGGGAAPRWTFAGTVYTSPAGGTAVAGATVRVTDAAGVVHELVTAQNGNFWTQEAVAFPLTIRASACPDTRQMSAPVPQTGASCNQSGCHDADFRISLP